MKRTSPKQRTRPDSELTFERERLLNLIDSRIRRKEIDDAKGLAEELFSTEMEFALLRKTKRLKRCNSLLLKVMVFLIGVLFASILCMVLNINPSFFLGVQAFTVLAIISAITINTVLVRRFGKTLKMMMDAYETVKQSFINGVLDSVMNRGNCAVRLDLLIDGVK